MSSFLQYFFGYILKIVFIFSLLFIFVQIKDIYDSYPNIEKSRIKGIFISLMIALFSNFLFQEIKSNYITNFEKCSEYNLSLFGTCSELKQTQNQLKSIVVSPITPVSEKTKTPTINVDPTKDMTKFQMIKSQIKGSWSCTGRYENFTSCDTYTFLDNNEVEIRLNRECSEFTNSFYLSLYDIVDTDEIEIYYFSNENPLEFSIEIPNLNNLIMFDDDTEIVCGRHTDKFDIKNLYKEPCISWTEANFHIGEKRCVEGIVQSIYDSENAFFINYSDNLSDFYAVSFNDKWNDTIINHCVRVFGTIEEYKGRPQIIISSKIHLTYCK
jgi:hypothetical protein